MAQQNGAEPAQPDSTAERVSSVGGEGLEAFIRGLKPEQMVPSKMVLGPTYPEVERGPSGSIILVLHHVPAQEMILVALDDATFDRLDRERKHREVEVADASTLAKLSEADRGRLRSA